MVILATQKLEHPLCQKKKCIMSQNTDEDQHEGKTHMTVAYSKGVLGVAWYDSTCGEVRCKLWIGSRLQLT